MKQNIIVLLVAVVLAVIIKIQYFPESDEALINIPVDGCNFATVKGEEFIFRTHDASLLEYTYQFWNKSPEINSEILAYDAYVGTHGKLQPGAMPGADQVTRWFVALTETCELIFSQNFDPGALDKNPASELESFTGIYFLETLEKGKSLVGKDVWTTIPYGVKKARFLFTSNPNIRYPSSNLQKLHVIGIDPHQYAYTFGGAPFSLVVKTETGEQALLPYSSRDFYKTSPIDAKWDPAIVMLIKNEKIGNGMSKAQALLSWGSPQKNNPSVGPNGEHEQWVYENGRSVELENDIVISFQISQ